MGIPHPKECSWDSFKKYFIVLCIRLFWLHECLHFVCAWCLGRQKPTEVSGMDWSYRTIMLLLGIEPQSSGKAVSAISHCVSPVLKKEISVLICIQDSPHT